MTPSLLIFFFCSEFVFCKLKSIKLLQSSSNLFVHFHNLPIVFLCTLKEFSIAVITLFFDFPSSNCSKRACRICCVSTRVKSLLGNLVSLIVNFVLKERSFVIFRSVQIFEKEIRIQNLNISSKFGK